MPRTSAAKAVATPDDSPAADWRRARTGVRAGDDESWLEEHETAHRTTFATVVGASALAGSAIWALVGYAIYRLAG